MSKCVKLILTCPQCGNSTWIPWGDRFKCAACQEFTYPEDMGATGKPYKAPILDSIAEDGDLSNADSTEV